MIHWSTDRFAETERFDAWRELRARHIFGVTAELEPATRAGFRAEMQAIPLGGAMLVDMQASAYRVERSPVDIARAPVDSLCVYQQRGGRGWFGIDGQDDFVLGAGALATSYSDLPYRTVPADGGFHLRIVKIPFALCRPLLRHDGRGLLAARPVDGDPGATTLFSAYFAAFVAQAPHLTGKAADAAVKVLAQLALAARGLAPAADEQNRIARREGRLTVAREIILRSLHDPALDATRVAGLMGISTRQLHMIFEPSGISVARMIKTARLAEAFHLITTEPGRRLTDIAFACGFDSLPTFYRAFRAAYDATPGELRAARGRER